MKDTIDIRICTGTTCYVMGASDLLTLEDHIPDNLKSTVKISGSTCLGLCRQNPAGSSTVRHLKPPFVQVCGKTIEQATIQKILDKIAEESAGAGYADNK